MLLILSCTSFYFIHKIKKNNTQRAYKECRNLRLITQISDVGLYKARFMKNLSPSILILKWHNAIYLQCLKKQMTGLATRLIIMNKIGLAIPQWVAAAQRTPKIENSYN